MAKVYFPDSLKRGTIPNIRRRYSYRRKTDHQQREEQQAFADEEEEPLDALYSDEEGDDENDDYSHRESSDEHDYDKQEDPLLADITSTPGNGRSRVLEFDQVQMSRAQVIKRLLFCSLMLNVTFMTWGALQERMLTRRYPRDTGDYFIYSYVKPKTRRDYENVCKIQDKRLQRFVNTPRDYESS